MPDAIACPSCLKRFKWTPKIAGRHVQCHCGQKFIAPEVAGGPVIPIYETGPEKTKPPADRDTYDLDNAPPDSPPQRQAALAKADKCPDCNAPVKPDAVVCVRCGFNLAAGEKIKTAVGQAPDADPPDAPGAPGAPGAPDQLAFGTSPVARALADRADELHPSKLRERYTPWTFLALGSLALPAVSWWGTPSLAQAGWHLLTNSGIAALSILAVFGAVLIATNILNLALTGFKSTLLKCLAVGLFGSFAADTLTVLSMDLLLDMGVHGIIGLACVTGALNLFLVGAPLLYLLELEPYETGLLTLILVILKSAGFFLLLALMGTF